MLVTLVISKPPMTRHGVPVIDVLMFTGLFNIEHSQLDRVAAVQDVSASVPPHREPVTWRTPGAIMNCERLQVAISG